MRGAQPCFTDEAVERNLALVDRVRSVAERYDATSGLVALAWLLARYDAWRRSRGPGESNA